MLPVFNQPVLHFYLALFMMVVAMIRFRDIRVAAVYLVVILNSVALVAVLAGTSDRYHLPIELCAFFLVCLPFALYPGCPAKTPVRTSS